MALGALVLFVTLAAVWIVASSQRPTDRTEHPDYSRAVTIPTTALWSGG